MKLSVGISMLLDLGQACLSKSPSEMDQDLLKEFIEGSHVAELVPWLHLFALLFEVRIVTGHCAWRTYVRMRTRARV